MNPVPCVRCGSEMNRSVETWNYEESGVDDVLLTGIEVRRCQGCGNVVPVIPNLVALHRTLAHAFATHRASGAQELAFLATYIELSGVNAMKPLGRVAYRLTQWSMLPRSMTELARAALCGAALLLVEQERAE